MQRLNHHYCKNEEPEISIQSECDNKHLDLLNGLLQMARCQWATQLLKLNNYLKCRNIFFSSDLYCE